MAYIFHQPQTNASMNLRKSILILPFLLYSIASYSQKTVAEFIKSGNQKESVKDYSGAAKDFTQAVRLDPKNTEALYNLGFASFELKDYETAIRNYDLAVAGDSESVELFYNRGNAKFELRDYKSAIDDYGRALFLDPDDKECYYNRAIAKYNTGESESACQDLQMAFKLGDKMADAVIKELCH